MGWFSDFISDPIGTVGETGQKLIDNPVPAITAAVTQNPAALLAYAAPKPQGTLNPQTGQLEYANVGNTIGGLLRDYGGMVGSQVSKEAIQAAQEEARRAGQQAAAMAQFRPVGITTRFGSSQFQVDPVTGQLVSAGYTPSATTTAYQDALAKMTEQGLMQGGQQQQLAQQYLAAQVGQPLSALGQQYLGESPEAIRQRYVEQQTALLAPQQEQQLANIRNQLFQTGRGGLSTGATAAGGMAATNPELAAYYNALANQQRQIAAGAEQAAQQQAQFGAGLFSQGLGLTQQGQQFGQQLGTGAFSPFTTGYAAQSALEQAALQPLSLGASLGAQASTSGAQAGRLGLAGGLGAAELGVRKELQYSPTASILGALTSPTSTLPAGLGNLYGGLFGVAPSWTTGADVIPTSTFGGYGDVSDLAQYGVF